MFKKEALKITAFYTFLFFLTINFQGQVFAQNGAGSNCKEINGRYFIANEYYRVCSIYQNPTDCQGSVNLTSYGSSEQCENASIQKYGCSPAIDGKVLYGYTNETAIDGVNFTNRMVTPGDASVCLEKLKDPIQNSSTIVGPYCKEGVRFFQCKCSKTLVGEAGTFGTIVSWVTGLESYSCFLKPIREPIFAKVNPINVASPLALLSVGVNMMFAFSALIVIFNLIRVGMMYVQSDGLPDELKKGRELFKNTLQGMVFFLVVIGLINYLINVFTF